jgi:P pilus assembly chaperone PapD
LTRPALFSALAALALVAAFEASAQPAAPAAPVPTVTTTTVGANLNISPKRVTFDRNRRSATVYIYNQGTAPATFDIGLIDRFMTPDGQIMAVNEVASRPELKPVSDRLASAQGMLLASPRRATLAPGQGQTIRLRVGNLPDAATGEYRTHLTITTIPPADVGITAEAAAAGAPNELRFQINSVFGLSIPAIIRVGEPDVRAGIQNARIEHAEISVDGQAPARRTPIMVFDLVREGANSLFGNIEIKPAGQRRAEPIGLARGVGVYTEIDRRTVRIPLNREPAAGEKLEITFTDDDTSPGKLLATQVP